MASPRDRVSELLEGRRRKTRQIVTPEGVAIDVDVADRGERLGICFGRIADGVGEAAEGNQGPQGKEREL